MNNVPLEFPEFYHDIQLQSKLDAVLESNKAIKKKNTYLTIGLVALGFVFIGTIVYFEQRKKEGGIGKGIGSL